MGSKFNVTSLIVILLMGAGIVLFAGNTDKKPRREIDTDNRLFPAGHLPDRITRNMPENPATELVFSWRTDSLTEQGYAEYLEATDSLNFEAKISIREATRTPVIFEGIKDHYFRVHISGLDPDTEYQVRVGGPEYRSEWFHVRTAPDDFQPWHFLHFGGVQHFIMEYGPRIYHEAASRFPGAQFISHSGDLVQARGGDDDWGEFFYAGRGIFNHFPLLPSAGNSDHWEVTTEDGDYRILYPQWHGVFHCPPGHAPNLANLAYFVDYPDTRMISLYTGMEASREDRDIFLSEDMRMSDSIFQQQMRWLDETLSNSPKKWNIVQMHHPVLSAREDRSYPRSEKYLQPILETHQVDLVLQSHEHLYARGSAPDSMLPVYLTTISGSRTKDLDENATWMTRAITGMQLYQAIFIEEEYLKVQTYSLSGNILDEFRIVKDAGNNSKRVLH